MHKTELSNSEIVTLIVGLLGGATNPIDVEDIAISSHEYFPQKFSWLKYPERVDLRVVQYSVRDACKKEMGLISGDSKQGYMLTKKGVEFYEKNFRLLTQMNDRQRKASSIDLIEKEKTRLRNSNAYRNFVDGKPGKIGMRDFQEFARVNDYFPPQIKRQRFSRIDNVVVGDSNLEQVWAFLKTKFFRGEIDDR